MSRAARDFKSSREMSRGAVVATARVCVMVDNAFTMSSQFHTNHEVRALWKDVKPNFSP